MDGYRKRDGIDTIARFYRQAAAALRKVCLQLHIFTNFCEDPVASSHIVI
jgi:hypothetical protein